MLIRQLTEVQLLTSSSLNLTNPLTWISTESWLRQWYTVEWATSSESVHLINIANWFNPLLRQDMDSTCSTAPSQRNTHSFNGHFMFDYESSGSGDPKLLTSLHFLRLIHCTSFQNWINIPIFAIFYCFFYQFESICPFEKVLKCIQLKKKQRK